MKYDENDCIELNKVLTRMKQVREYWRPLWEQTSKYVNPRRFQNEFQKSSTQTEGKNETTELFDSTAVYAAQTSANGLQGYSCSPAYPWVRFGFTDKQLTKNASAKAWLDMAMEKVYGALQSSNFYTAINETILDGVSISTATMFVDEDIASGRIRFIPINPWEIFIAENPLGEVDVVFRRYQETRRNIWEKYQNGFDNTEKAEYEKKVKENPLETEWLIHAVFPRDGMGPNLTEIAKREALNKKFASVVYIENQSSSKPLDCSGYDTMPYPVWRYRKNSNETYGRGPGIDCTSDAMMLNQMARSLLIQAQFNAEPMLQAPASINDGRRELDIRPRGVQYYVNPDELVQKIDLGGSYEIGKDLTADRRKRIEESFHLDVFLMINSIPREVTVPELAERQGEKAALLGAVLARAAAELYNPILTRVIDILMRNGTITPLPAALGEGAKLKIEYIGPMAEMQRRYLKTTGFNQVLGSLAPIAQVGGPQIFDTVDLMGIAMDIVEESSLPNERKRTKEEIDKIGEQRAQIAAQQKQEAMQLAIMNNASNIAKAQQPGSIGAALGLGGGG